MPNRWPDRDRDLDDRHLEDLQFKDHQLEDQLEDCRHEGRRQDDHRWMMRAIELSHRCPVVTGAYAVGAVLVDAEGRELAWGYSREHDPSEHAEESVLAKLETAIGPSDRAALLAKATLYSSLEPCSQRKSRPKTCTQHIIDAGIGRVVIAWREPSLFVADCQGVEQLTAAGVEVVELTGLADLARRTNDHLGA